MGDKRSQACLPEDRESAALASKESSLAADSENPEVHTTSWTDEGDEPALSNLAAELQRYRDLQRMLYDLRGLQIPSQAAAARRRVRSLEKRLEQAESEVETSRQAVTQAQIELAKHASGAWYPGKLFARLVKGRQVAKQRLEASRQELERSNQRLAQRKAACAEVEACLQEAKGKLEGWGQKAAELATAQQAAQQLLGQLIQDRDAYLTQEGVGRAAATTQEGGTTGGGGLGDRRDGIQGSVGDPGPAASAEAASSTSQPPGSSVPPRQGGYPAVPGVPPSEGSLAGADLEGGGSEAGGGEDGSEGQEVEGLLAALCALTDEEEEEEEAEGGSGDAGAVLDGAEADKRGGAEGGGPREGSEAEANGAARKRRLFQGRLLLEVAGKLGRSGRQRGQQLRRVFSPSPHRSDAHMDAALHKISMGGLRGPLKLQGRGQYAKDFPPAANSFNPLLHCPPGTFLWPYRSKFLGKVQRLQTGPVLQAYCRFGPFDCDPVDPGRLSPAGGVVCSETGELVPAASEAGAAAAATSRQPPLILLPGLGATMISWGVPLLRALACSHEVIIMEYRGAGWSVDSSGEPWDYYKQAEAVLLLSDALGLRRPNILGWSSGGDVGLVLAALHGERVGKVASLAGMAGGKNTVVPPMYEMLNPDRRLTLGQTMALLFPADDPQEFHKNVSDYLKSVVSMPGSITNAEVKHKTAKEQWEADQVFIHSDEQVWDALPSIQNPVLIMNGTRDILVPQVNAERLAAHIPGAKLHLFQSWGHAFQDPAELAEVVTDFILDD